MVILTKLKFVWLEGNKYGYFGGKLRQDPEVKYTAGGAAVTTLSLATSESWKDKDTGQDQEKQNGRVVLWRRLAEMVGEYLKKGSGIYRDSYKLENGSKMDKPDIPQKL